MMTPLTDHSDPDYNTQLEGSTGLFICKLFMYKPVHSPVQSPESSFCSVQVQIVAGEKVPAALCCGIVRLQHTHTLVHTLAPTSLQLSTVFRKVPVFEAVHLPLKSRFILHSTASTIAIFLQVVPPSLVKELEHKTAAAAATHGTRVCLFVSLYLHLPVSES